MTQVVFEPSQTTHWKNLFPNKMLLLGSQNLNEGEELIAIISFVQVEEIKNQQGATEKVPVARFENAPPMVLNITNTRTIASLYGERYDEWAGKAIQIYATEVNAFGQKTTALRIREAIPDTNQDVSGHESALRACTTMQDLQKVFMAIPKHLKPRLVAIKDEMKGRLNEGG